MDKKSIKQSIKPAFWGAVFGAIAMAIVGFNWGGWVTGGTAKEMAAEAVVHRLVPICVGQFNMDSNKVSKLAAMKKADSWKQADFVVKQGWATMPGADKANNEVAEACASEITS